MQYSNFELKLNIIVCAVIVILLLFILKTVIKYFLNKKTLQITERIIIGQEEIQEDNVKIVTKENEILAIVSDGFGFNEAGKAASNICVNTIGRMFKNEEINERYHYFIKKSFNKTNHEVLTRIEEGKGGASVTAAIINKNKLYYGLVGDVMLAVFRKRELVRISEGHTMDEIAKKEYYQGHISKEDAVCTINNKKVLYYFGKEPFDHIEFCNVPITLYKNDIVVIMTRGIYENIRWIDIERILKKGKSNIEEACNEIIENTSQRKNGSIVLIKYCSSK